MKILVIGASGFIGKNIYSLAKKKGYDALGTGFRHTNSEYIFFDMLSQRIEDVLPTRFVDGEMPAYAIICSSIPKIDICCMDKENSYQLNVIKTKEIINQLETLGFRIAFLSTEAVFDGKDGYYDEVHPVNPVNEYGRQKVEIEEYILRRKRHHLIFRLSMIVSSEVEKGHLFYEWYSRVSKKEPIKCISGQIFSPTDVKDASKGILIAFERQLEGVYHLTNSEYFERSELAEQFLRIIKADTEITRLELKRFGFLDERAIKTYLDGSKFINDTGMVFNSMKQVMTDFWNNAMKMNT